MLNGLPPLGITAGLSVVAFGGWTLVAYFVRLIFTGRVVSRTTLEDVEHDRDEWRAAHRISEQARLEEREHNAALVHDIAEPVKGFLEGFRKATRSEVDSE